MLSETTISGGPDDTPGAFILSGKVGPAQSTACCEIARQTSLGRSRSKAGGRSFVNFFEGAATPSGYAAALWRWRHTSVPITARCAILKTMPAAKAAA